MRRATSIFVPTPSVDVASNGLVMVLNSLISNSPAKPPKSPTTSLRDDFAIALRIRSTARSPASVSTPAAAYEDLLFASLKVGEPLHQLRSVRHGQFQNLPAHAYQVLLHREVQLDTRHQSKLGTTGPLQRLSTRLMRQER